MTERGRGRNRSTRFCAANFNFHIVWLVDSESESVCRHRGLKGFAFVTVRVAIALKFFFHAGNHAR